MACFSSGTCILTADRRHRKLGTYAPAACQGDQAAIEGDEQDDTGYTDALYYRSVFEFFIFCSRTHSVFSSCLIIRSLF